MNPKICLLLVEDNPGDIRLIMEMLKETKKVEFAITNSARLDESLKLLDEKQFKVILLDLGLPDSQGLDTFKKVRSHAPGLPVVILTGLDDESVALQAIKAGAQDYLTKSEMNSDNLVRILQYAIERKQAEGELKTSSLATETSMNAIFAADLKGIITYANTSASKMWGYKCTEEMIGTNAIEYWTESTQGKAGEMIGTLLKEGKVASSGVLIGKRLDGTEFIVESNSVIIKDENGKPVGLIGSFSDITERKQAQLKLRASEKKYKDLFIKMMNAFALHEMIFNENGEPTDYKFLEVNPAWEKIVGINSEIVIDKTIREIMPDIEDSWIQLYGRVVKTGIPEEFEDYNKATQKYYHVYAYCAGPGKFAVLFNDITQRKKAEDDLKNSENLLSAAELLAGQGSWEWDIVKDEWTFSENWRRIHGVDVTGITRKELMTLAYSDDAARIEASFQAALEGTGLYDLEHRIVRKNDGQVRDVQALGTVIRNAAGQPVKMYGVFQDITERKQAEEELVKHRLHLEELVKERTSELEEKNNELERFHDATIDREFRIKELRDEIDELKNRVKD